MFKRQTSGSVVCPTCGKLVGVKDAKCYNCGRPFPGMFGFAPLFRSLGQDLGFVPLMMGLAGIVYALTLVADPSGIQASGGWRLLSPSGASLVAFGASGPVPVFRFGRWWTLLSAGWLHGGLLHIGFNLYWLHYFGPSVAELYGAGRMVIVYTVGSIVGFALSSLSIFVLAVPGLNLLGFVLGGGGGITVGASAGLFGLLGAMVLYGHRVSSAVGRQAWIYVALFFIFGLLWRGVDNWAHLGGFIGGYLSARVMNPLTAERGDHLIWALVCLAASVAAVVLSVITGWGLLQH